MEKFFSTFEVAKMCHVSPGSVIRWIREGKLTAAVTVGGHHRINSRDVLELLESLRMPIPADFEDQERRELPAKGGALKILIVDDEAGMRNMIRMILEGQFHRIQIEEASDGFEAGWKAHQARPDLVILDLMLPKFDGYRVCQLIRTFPQLKHTKIIAVTGVPDPEAQQKILKIGADDFLAKPFDLDVLRDRIVNQLMSIQGVLKLQ